MSKENFLVLVGLFDAEGQSSKFKGQRKVKGQRFKVKGMAGGMGLVVV